MKKIAGFSRLIEERHNLPKTGWVFVDREVDTTTGAGLSEATFYVPENDDDEFDGEESLATLVEAPMLVAILQMREKNVSRPSTEQYLSAVLHYLKNDDFLE